MDKSEPPSKTDKESKSPEKDKKKKKTEKPQKEKEREREREKKSKKDKKKEKERKNNHHSSERRIKKSKKHRKKSSSSPSVKRDDKKRSRRRSKEKESKKKSEKRKSGTPKQEQQLETKEERIMKLMMERRQRSRSNSAVRYYQKQITANNPLKKQNTLPADKQDMFWDGFQWVPKTNTLNKLREDKEKILIQTKRMRTIQLCNIPTGLTDRDLYTEISRFMSRNYLNDMQNTKPVLACNLNEKDRTCILELSSAEEANRVLKLENMKLLDEECKIVRLGESIYGQERYIFQNKLRNLKYSQQQHLIQHWAQAQAAAINALKTLGSNKGTTSDDDKLAQAGKRVYWDLNLRNSVENNKEWNEMYDDLLTEFAKFGMIEDDFFVRPYQSGLGAEAGSLFIVYQAKEEAQKTVMKMSGRSYNQRDLKIIFINEQTYVRSYLPLKFKPKPVEEEQYNVRMEYNDEDDESGSEESANEFLKVVDKKEQIQTEDKVKEQEKEQEKEQVKEQEKEQQQQQQQMQVEEETKEENNNKVEVEI